MKQIDITDADLKQVVVVYKLLQEAKFEIKGDAVNMTAAAMSWVVDLHKRMKDAKEPEIVSSDIQPKKRSK